MTELEQKAEEYLKENCCDMCVLADDCKADTITCFSKDCYITGYEHGYKSGYSDGNNAVNKELQDAYNVLKEDNKDLKEKLNYSIMANFIAFKNECEETVKTLKAQIEKMKHCPICKYDKQCVRPYGTKTCEEWELAE